MVRIEIRGNKFYFDETTKPGDESRGYNQYAINIQKRGGKWAIYYDTNKISREYENASNFLDGANGDAPFADDRALTDWFDLNTGNKTGGGTGQTAAQVEAAISANNKQSIALDGSATHDDAVTEKAVADEFLKKIDKPIAPLTALQQLRVNAAGTDTEWFTPIEDADEWQPNTPYTVEDQTIAQAPPGVTETAGTFWLIQPKANLTSAAVMDATEWALYDVISEGPAKGSYKYQNLELGNNFNYDYRNFDEDVVTTFFGGFGGGQLTIKFITPIDDVYLFTDGQDLRNNAITADFIIKIEQGTSADVAWHGQRVFVNKHTLSVAWKEFSQSNANFLSTAQKRYLYGGARLRFNGTTTANDIGKAPLDIISEGQEVEFHNDGVAALVWDMPNLAGDGDEPLAAGQLARYRYLETANANGYHWVLVYKFSNSTTAPNIIPVASITSMTQIGSFYELTADEGANLQYDTFKVAYDGTLVKIG